MNIYKNKIRELALVQQRLLEIDAEYGTVIGVYEALKSRANAIEKELKEAATADFHTTGELEPHPAIEMKLTSYETIPGDLEALVRQHDPSFLVVDTTRLKKEIKAGNIDWAEIQKEKRYSPHLKKHLGEYLLEPEEIEELEF